MLHRNDIRIRDPFIYTDRKAGIYYMYGTTDLRPHSIAADHSFSCYRSTDLEWFEGPIEIFNAETAPFWGERDFWAAEMHAYGGRYYLFASCKSDTRHRGTQIFVCDTPDGRYVPVAPDPATPADWECLDGTLFVEDGIPYMVFCHEWTQVRNGEICAIPLLPDLSGAAGEPFLLFRATDEPMVAAEPNAAGNYVTDGPFLWREDGRVHMIWSSFAEGRYQVFDAVADRLRGAWQHLGSRFDFDGGHAMLFETLAGERMISLHAPNTSDAERAVFRKI